MEQGVWLRAGMVVTVLVLVVLILVTPSLLGRPSSELGSLPLLIIGMSRNESWFIVNLGAAVQAYRYDLLRITIRGANGSTNWSFNVTASETEGYGVHLWVRANVTCSIHAYAVDRPRSLFDRQRNFFEYNVTARAQRDQLNRTVMVFGFPDERGPANEVRVGPPEDFRRAIPWRGILR